MSNTNLNYVFSFDDPLNNSIKDQLNDFDITMLRIIGKIPGLNASKILRKLNGIYSNATLDMVKNSLKRKLSDLCEYTITII